MIQIKGIHVPHLSLLLFPWECGKYHDQGFEALLAEIQGDVARSRDESYAEIAGPVVDSADEAVADLLADMDSAETSRDLNEERELEAAQARLEDGTFGKCVDCGLEIGLARLRAVPTAARCVKCQAVHEKTYAHQGEPKL